MKDLSLFRLYVLRGMYLFIVVGPTSCEVIVSGVSRRARHPACLLRFP